MGHLLGPVDGSFNATQNWKVIQGFYFLHRTFQESFNVIGDDLDESFPEVLENTPGLPQYGDVKREASCRGHRLVEQTTVIKQDGFPSTLFVIECEYDNMIDFESITVPAIEGHPAKRSWDGVMEEVEFIHDIETGEPVATKAFERMYSKTEACFPILQIQRWEFGPFDPTTILAYVNRCNETAFYGAPPGTALMLPIQTEEMYHDRTLYVQVTYRIKFWLDIDPTDSQIKTDTWRNAEFVHQGTQYLENAGDFIAKQAVDEDGNPITVNLAADGTKGGPSTLVFKRRAYAEFNNLILGP
jgi:hypothetical protein